MARNSERVVSALNRLTDRVFVDALSAGDQSAMSDLVADFFCGDPDTDISDSEEEEEPGNWPLQYLLLIIICYHNNNVTFCIAITGHIEDPISSKSLKKNY